MCACACYMLAIRGGTTSAARTALIGDVRRQCHDNQYGARQLRPRPGNGNENSGEMAGGGAEPSTASCCRTAAQASQPGGAATITMRVQLKPASADLPTPRLTRQRCDSVAAARVAALCRGATPFGVSRAQRSCGGARLYGTGYVC